MKKLYLRKSRSDNAAESVEEVLDRHERQLQEFCLRRYGAVIPEKDIMREVVSGETIDDRPVMKQLLKEIETGLVEEVIVIEPQRLSRGSFGDIDRIVKTFMYMKTLVATPTKTYDLNNKFDKKYFEQELLRGNDYLEYVKEILVRGRIRSVEDGYYIGSALPYGYDKLKVPKKGYKLIPNKYADNVKYIFDKFLEGLGTTMLAKHLIEIGMESYTKKQWTPNMVRNILTNTLYIGIVTYGRREVKRTMVDGEIIKSRPWNDDYITAKGLHEPIITKEVFDKAQELLKAIPGKNVSGTKEIRSPLAGLVYCKFCGEKMIRRPYTRTTHEPTILCKTFGCNCVSSDLGLVEKRVIELLKKELENYKYFISNYEQENANNTKDYSKQIASVEKELKELNEDLLNALVKYNRGKITEQEYDYLRNYTTEEKTRLEKLRDALNEKLENNEYDDKRKAIPILEKCIDEYFNLSIKDKHSLLTSIIDHITYSKTEKGRWNPDAINSFSLELFLKI